MKTPDQSTDIPEATDSMVKSPAVDQPAIEADAHDMTPTNDTPGGGLTSSIPATSTLDEFNVQASLEADAHDMTPIGNTPVRLIEGGDLTNPVPETDENNATGKRRSNRIRKQIMNIDANDIGECEQENYFDI